MCLPLFLAVDNGVLGELAAFNLPRGDTSGNFGPSGVDDAWVVRVLPPDQFFDQIEELRPLEAGAVFIDCAVGLAIRQVAVGSSTREVNSTARQAASGRCAHHLCSVVG